MFHVKPLSHKAFDNKELRLFCIKKIVVKEKLQCFRGTQPIKAAKTRRNNKKYSINL